MASSSNGAKDYKDSEVQIDPEDDKMEAETEEIVRGFLYTRLSSRVEEEGREGNLDVACIPQNVLRDLRGAVPSSESPTMQLGSTLAAIGDEIQFKYRDTFQDMICQLQLTPDTAYDAFASVTRRLFTNGISWGRIVALLCFGYEIAISVIQQGARGVVGFLKKIVRYVVNFILSEKIGQWIASHGGWAALITGSSNDVNFWIGGVAVSVVLALTCVWLLNNGEK